MALVQNGHECFLSTPGDTSGVMSQGLRAMTQHLAEQKVPGPVVYSAWDVLTCERYNTSSVTFPYFHFLPAWLGLVW